MELDEALAWIGARRHGVLTTIRSNGRPQLSNVSYAVGVDDTIRVSITADRAKYVNLVRDARASLHVTRDDFYAYVVIDGDAALAPVTVDVADSTSEALVDLYRKLAGEHPDWDEYRAAMIVERRTVLTITPTHAYGMLAG